MSADTLVLVDTNVLVYAFDETKPERRRIAETVISELMNEDRIRLSTQVLQELYVTMTRKVGRPWTPDDALTLMEDLSAWPIVVVDTSLIREAILLSRDSQISFWDSLIVIAAAECGASLLYTEDLTHGQTLRGVRIFNPFHRKGKP